MMDAPTRANGNHMLYPSDTPEDEPCPVCGGVPGDCDCTPDPDAGRDKEVDYLAYAEGYRPALHDYYRCVRWTITFATRRRRDKGNWEKILNDALVYSGLVEDDSDQRLYWYIELNPEPGRRGVEVELW